MTARPNRRPTFRFLPTLGAGFVAGSALLAGRMDAAPAPTPTPTPAARRHLSGGFGRTPVPAPEGDGQSLADVVRAASAAREHKDQKGVSITNQTLVTDPKKGRISTSQPASATPATTPGRTTLAALPTPSPAPTPAAPASNLSSADEALWKDRAHRTRQRVVDLKAAITSLEGETKQLETDFYRWDDGQYRDRVIKPAWDKKREELETAKQQLVQAEAELADLPEQARTAGALPGWLRE